jgi:transmembrane sensor
MPDFAERLRALDAELARERPSAAAESRLRALVESGPDRSLRAWRGWALATAAGLCLVGGLAWLLRPGAPQVRGFTVVRGAIEPRDQGLVRCRSATCRLDSPAAGVGLELELTAEVAHRGRDLAVASGRVKCRVRPRPSGDPARVFVSHGVIEVLGTTFVVAQRTDGGEVALVEGRIRFRGHDGVETELRPGERLSWPRPPAAASAAEPPASRPASVAGRPPATRPAVASTDGRAVQRRTDTESLYERVEALRAQERYREAAAELRRHLPGVRDQVTRERLSFELGTILTRHLRDPAAACRHWEAHLGEHGAKRYGAAVEELRRSLRCSGERAP